MNLSPSLFTLSRMAPRRSVLTSTLVTVGGVPAGEPAGAGVVTAWSAVKVLAQPGSTRPRASARIGSKCFMCSSLLLCRGDGLGVLVFLPGGPADADEGDEPAD